MLLKMHSHGIHKAIRTGYSENLLKSSTSNRREVSRKSWRGASQFARPCRRPSLESGYLYIRISQFDGMGSVG